MSIQDNSRKAKAARARRTLCWLEMSAECLAQAHRVEPDQVPTYRANEQIAKLQLRMQRIIDKAES